jgi:CubicO group peptidase (beta-lactamase class C family)
VRAPVASAAGGRQSDKLSAVRICVTILALAFSLSAVGDPLGARIGMVMTRERVPGLALAVVRHGRLVRSGAYGVANVEWKAPVTIDTKFEIASISKMFVGAAIRVLIEEGKVSPEDSLSKYFDGLPAAWNGMRVRHLITMSSGLPEDFASDLIPYDQDVTTPYDDGSMLHAFFTLKMAAPVGDRFVYSSPNYAMLGMIAAKVAGKPFPAFVRERIFGPAGMTSSSYIDNSAVVSRRADGYRRTRTGELKKGWYLGQYLHSRPDDGVLTTASDLGKWIVALDQRKIVREPDKLWDSPNADSGRPLDYSYGWMTDTWLGHRRQSHSGGYRTGFHTFIARYPDDDLGIVVLTNCDFSSVRDYVNLVARAYLPMVPDPSVLRTHVDSEPEVTRRMAAAVLAVARGTIDDSAMFADALEPIGLDQAAAFLKAIGPLSYAGRARLQGDGIRMHGHTLVDYETLETSADGHTLYLTLYRDPSGKIAYFEATN